jgi:hypothetical protein
VRVALVTLLCSPVLVGCHSVPQIAPDIGAHRFGETFSTPAGGKMEMVEEKIIVSFKELLEDSRCPKQVTCVWQGAATVRLVAMVQGNQPNQHDFQLATAPESARSAAYEGYRIELIDVEPHPQSATQPPPDDYQVSLRVTRAP